MDINTKFEMGGANITCVHTPLSPTIIDKDQDVLNRYLTPTSKCTRNPTLWIYSS